MRPSGDSTADGPANRRTGERKCTSFDGFAHPLGEGDGCLERRAREDQHEFLAAIAAHPVDLPRVVAQNPGELAQYLVAGLMAMGVVDTLEHVEIAHHARERLAQADRVLEGLFEAFLEAAAVVDACQGIGAGDAHELVVDRVQLRSLALDLFLQRLDPKERSDPCLQLGEVDRLGDVVVGPRVETDDLVLGRVERRLNDDRNEGQGLIALDAPCDLEAVELGKHDVEQNEIRERFPRASGCVMRARERRDDREGFLAIARLNCRVPTRLQAVAQDRHVVRVVVDDEDARAGACAWRGCRRRSVSGQRRCRSERRVLERRRRARRRRHWRSSHRAASDDIGRCRRGLPRLRCRPVGPSEKALHLGHDGARLAGLREIAVASDFHRALAVGR
jgi:hypothetical protein